MPICDVFFRLSNQRSPNPMAKAAAVSAAYYLINRDRKLTIAGESYIGSPEPENQFFNQFEVLVIEIEDHPSAKAVYNYLQVGCCSTLILSLIHI